MPDAQGPWSPVDSLSVTSVPYINYPLRLRRQKIPSSNADRHFPFYPASVDGGKTSTTAARRMCNGHI